MMNIINDEAFDVRKGIVRHEEGVDLLPGNIELSGLEASLLVLSLQSATLLVGTRKKAPVFSISTKYECL